MSNPLDDQRIKYLEMMHDWYREQSMRQERARIAAIPEWHLWILARSPRPIALTIVALGEMLLDALFWIIIGIILCVAVGGFVSSILWILIALGMTLEMNIHITHISFALAFVWPVGVFLKMIVDNIKKADENLPRREKKL